MICDPGHFVGSPYINISDLIEDEEYRLEENASVTLESLIND